MSERGQSAPSFFPKKLKITVDFKSDIGDNSCMLSKEKSMKNFEIVKDYYNWQNDPRREAANSVSPDDQYTLAGRSYRAIPYGAEVGLFTNKNATEADRLSRKFVSYEGDSIEGNAKNAFFDGNIVRWKSNGRVPFGDMLLDFYHCGYITKEQMIESAILQEKGNDEFWANVKTEKYYNAEEGEWMVRFIPGKSSFREGVKYTDQKSVA